MKLCLVALATLLSAGALACSNDSVGIEDSAPPPPPPNEVPKVGQITLPTWPPMGKGGHLDVAVSDDQADTTVSARFAGSSVKNLQLTNGTVRFFGFELGEGYGDLYLSACDRQRACRERRVEKLLVDMTPPDIELERDVVSALVDGIDGDVGVWVRDGWVLGSVEITYGGKTLKHAFPQAYPSTLGTKPDVSRVGFPAKSLPVGNGLLAITATDAAGNVSTKSVKLRIDATKPLVQLLEPAPGAQVKGAFVVRVAATDDGGQPPTVDLFVGGARVLSNVVPSAPFVLDTSTLTPGIHEVRAIARDDAGNESVAAQVDVEVLP